MASSRHLSPTDIMLSSGALLIVVGVFVLASTGWQSFSPASRIVTALLPLVALYGIGFLGRRQAGAAQRSLSQATLLTGSAILPIVLGITVYQSGMYPYLDSTLVFGVSLVSLLWFCYLEFSLRERWHAVGTIVAACALALSFGETVGLVLWGYSFLAVLLAYFFLSISRHYSQESEDGDRLQLAACYAYVGAALGVGGLLTFPLYLVDTYALGDLANVYLLVAFALGSALLFLAAIGYSAEWKSRKEPLDLMLRQVAENASALFLTVPALLVALGTDRTGDILTAIILSLGAVILGWYVRVAAFRAVGSWAAVIAVVKLLFFAVTQVGAGWPILLLVVGFLLIGLAYLAQHEGRLQRLRQIIVHPEQRASLYGLGIDPENKRPRSRLLGGERAEGTATFATRSGTPLNGGTVLLAIAVLVFLLILVRLMSVSLPTASY